jgi:hypothetical protein
LHACGDLSVSMLRQFVNGDAKAVVNVGCCYNCLTEKYSKEQSNDETDGPVYGFPVSQHLLAKKAELGYSQRMIATQATCRWALAAEHSLENFKKHGWRAILQVLIRQLFPNLDPASITVGKLPRLSFKKDFTTYCKAAFAKLRLPEPEQQRIKDLEETYDSRRMKELEVFLTLRGLISELVESVILLDRLVYLQEHDIESQLVALFPHTLSPRNIAIVGIKKQLNR